MIIKYIKKIVITHLLGVYSLMLIGCSQPGVNMMGPFGVVGAWLKKFNRSGTEFSVKNTFARDRVRADGGDIIVQYKIDNNDQLLVKSVFDTALCAKEKSNRDKHQRLFDFFAQIIPQKYRKGIQYVEIFDPKDSSMCAYMDGEYGDFLKTFRFGIPFDLFDNEKYYIRDILNYPFIICTMIHELGHYLTSNHKQIYLLRGRPTPKKKSILKKIWSISYSFIGVYNYLGRDLRLGEDSAPSEDYFTCYETMAKLLFQGEQEYLQREKFVSKYAKKSFFEDAAETFVYFVLLDERPKPNVSVEKDKVLLFWKDQKFVKIRKAIRANLEKLGIRPHMSRDDTKKLLGVL